MGLDLAFALGCTVQQLAPKKASVSVLISVVVATYNRSQFLPLALQALYDQSLDKNQFEVLLVDNASTDNTASVCRAFQAEHPAMQLHYLQENQQGASFARNTGAAQAKGKIICCLDDDAVAAPDYLFQAVAFHFSHPKIAGWGGKIIPRYLPAAPHWMSPYVASMVGHFDHGPQTKEFAPNRYPLESNMFVLKSFYDDLKGFNTALPGVQGSLRIGGEGKDFFLRLKARGEKIFYTPQMVVEHIVEVSKLTPAYFYGVASGYGRGEKVRTLQISRWAYPL
ncbi:MAG: glycosyltransferase [Sphingobacteriia bacterium]|nr:MAG: glycosyltransferase [Sphingobacteriia bacterium]